jgi:hypothetical protein
MTAPATSSALRGPGPKSAPETMHPAAATSGSTSTEIERSFTTTSPTPTDGARPAERRLPI